jgi:hypothetical protein
MEHRLLSPTISRRKLGDADLGCVGLGLVQRPLELTRRSRIRTPLCTAGDQFDSIGLPVARKLAAVYVGKSPHLGDGGTGIGVGPGG